MLTNLVAAVIVTISTNVSEQVTGYARYVPAPCPDSTPGYGCSVNHTKGVDPNHKTITTNVIETTTLTFDWLGQKREIKQERVLSSTSYSIELKWTPTTNSPNAPSYYNSVTWDDLTGTILLIK